MSPGAISLNVALSELGKRLSLTKGKTHETPCLEGTERLRMLSEETGHVKLSRTESEAKEQEMVQVKQSEYCDDCSPDCINGRKKNSQGSRKTLLLTQFSLAVV